MIDGPTHQEVVMDRADLFAAINRIEGVDHHERNAQLLRNGRWGTCVDCPRRRDGQKAPERCINTRRYDHDIEITEATRDVLRRYKHEKYRNHGTYFYDTDDVAVAPTGKPGGRWAVVDFAGRLRLRTHSKRAARRFAAKSYVAGMVRRWHRGAA
jgi:hypothetical protein